MAIVFITHVTSCISVISDNHAASIDTSNKPFSTDTSSRPSTFSKLTLDSSIPLCVLTLNFLDLCLQQTLCEQSKSVTLHLGRCMKQYILCHQDLFGYIMYELWHNNGGHFWITTDQQQTTIRKQTMITTNIPLLLVAITSKFTCVEVESGELLLPSWKGTQKPN